MPRPTLTRPPHIPENEWWHLDQDPRGVFSLNRYAGLTTIERHGRWYPEEQGRAVAERDRLNQLVLDAHPEPAEAAL